VWNSVPYSDGWSYSDSWLLKQSSVPYVKNYITPSFTFLVQSWNCLNSSWYRFNMVYFDQYWHGSIICWLHMQLSRSTLPKSSDWEVYLSIVNSSSCSRNQLEMIWPLWRAMLSWWVQPSEDGYTHCVHKWMNMVVSNSQVGCDI